MRAQIRAEVQSLAPLDDLEAETIRSVTEWIDSGVEICRISKPDNPPKHLVSYAVLVDGDFVLLADHKKALRWLPTGGHVEPGEHPRVSAQREIEEELQIPGVLKHQTPILVTETTTVGLTAGHTDASLWYVMIGDRSKRIEFDTEEFNDVRWFHRDAIHELERDPHMDRFMKKKSTQ